MISGVWGRGGGSRARRLRLWWCVAALCSAGLESATAFAGELGYGGGYSVAHDSNITRVPIDPIADWTQTLFGGFAYQESTSDLNMRILAQAERRMYSNTYVDEKAYFLDAFAVWSISPKQFTWMVADYANQVPISLTAVDTPTNRTNANSFNTGPDLTYRISPSDSAALAARYGRLDIQGPGDNERYSGSARLLHQMSTEANLSLNYVVTRVDFQDPSSFIDYLLEAWFVRFEVRPSPSGITVDLGRARVDQGGVPRSPARYARIALAYQLTHESSLYASAESQYSDTAIDLLGGVTSALQPPAAPSTISATAITGPYYGRRADLGFNYGGERLQFTARGYARSVDYLQSDQSYDERNGHVELTWFYSGTTRVRAYSDYTRRAFLDFFEEDTVRVSSLAVGYKVNRNISIGAEASLVQGQSTVPANNFVDRRASLSVSFTTGPLYPAASRR
jgi:hypothetical protein